VAAAERGEVVTMLGELVEHRGEPERRVWVAEPALLRLSGLVPQPRGGPVDDLLVGHAERPSGRAARHRTGGSPRQASGPLGGAAPPGCVLPGPFYAR
jgi:hypothetical protein